MKNVAILIGRSGKDPDVKTFDNGNKIASFSLATSETYKNKQGEKVTNTEWHNIVVQNKQVDVVEKYVKKGQLLAVEGKIKTRSWESNGEKKYITEIVVDFSGSVTFLSKAPDGSSEAVEAEVIKDDDDLPF